MLRLPILFFSSVILWQAMLVPAVAKVSIVAEGSPLAITAAGYDARIEADGCLTNLRIDGREFLAPGVSISRGSYFFLGGPLKLTKVERVSDNVVAASSDAASIRYEFGDTKMVWQLTNKTDDGMVLFIVFAKEVDAALDAGGAPIATPVNKEWSDVALLAGDAKLQIGGCDKLWGPWEGPHQVCQVSLKPKEEKRITLSVGRVSASEQVKLQALVPAVAEPKLQLFSPRRYQVFQRSTANMGTILVSGHTTTDADEIKARITGNSIGGPLSGQSQTLPMVAATHSFSAELPLSAGGWYTIDVQVLKGGTVLAETKVEQFGVGEVFVGAGQSNSTNFGEVHTKPKSGMVSSFSGEEWQLADDPQPGVADHTQGGSFWPAFGDAMYARFGVPIGVASTGYGGTSVNQWQPSGELFPWMMRRVEQLGPFGFRALLWHQGESDVDMPSVEYYAKLKNVIQSSRAQAGWYVPWFVAQASYHNPEQPRFENVRNAQSRLWKDGVALPGPDTDTITGDCRELGGKGIHFSAKGLLMHGQMWAECIGRYVERILHPKALDEDAKSASSRPLRVTAEAWTEADAMFHRDPRWLGGDDAYSIDLGGGRVAWFFGDSFVSPSVAGQRRATTMVHNSVGIQTGYDPTSAKFKAYWRVTDDKPTSFFPDDGVNYFWPGGSLLVDGKLLVFFMQAHTKDPNNAMGFDTDGWAAVLIDNLEADPDRWQIRRLEAPQNRFRVLVGSASIVRDSQYIVAFSVGDDTHSVYLVRWPMAAAAAGNLRSPEWWVGAEQGWVKQKSLGALPAPLITHAQTEFTVHFSRQLDRFLQFQFEGFPLTPIGFRTARSLTGTWSSLTQCYRPAELGQTNSGLMLYAAKAHPEQSTDGLALTYASNTYELARLLDSQEIYYPRFFRVKLDLSDK
jgi:Carbohydrate esterase, sialic acid-specific acetylesterase